MATPGRAAGATRWARHMLVLELMIGPHQDALDVMTDRADPVIQQMAGDLSITLQAQIVHMEQVIRVPTS